MAVAVAVAVTVAVAVAVAAGFIGCCATIQTCQEITVARIKDFFVLIQDNSICLVVFPRDSIGW